MWKLLFKSRKVRAIMQSLLAAILTMVLGIACNTLAPETAKELGGMTAALVLAILEVFAGVGYAVGVAIEDNGEKAAGVVRDKNGDRLLASRPGSSPSVTGGFPKPRE